MLHRHRDPVPLGQRIKIALQISEALAYLHSKRIAHFDVKPEQILIRFSSHSRTRRVARTLAQILFPEDSDHLLACPDCDVSARLIDYGTALRFAKDSPYINARLENGKRWRGDRQTFLSSQSELYVQERIIISLQRWS